MPYSRDNNVRYSNNLQRPPQLFADNFDHIKEAIRDIDPKSFNIYLWDNSTQPLPAITYEIENLTIIRQNPEWANAEEHTRYNNVVCDAFVRSDKEYILSVDSDACFHPQFYEKGLELLRDLPGIGYAGIFNNWVPALETIQDKYVRKESIGFFCTLINRALWHKRIEANGGNKTGNVETGYAQFCYANGPHGVCVTKRSYVEHIGMTGAHHWGDGTIDRAQNFLD